MPFINVYHCMLMICACYGSIMHIVHTINYWCMLQMLSICESCYTIIHVTFVTDDWCHLLYTSTSRFMNSIQTSILHTWVHKFMMHQCYTYDKSMMHHTHTKCIKYALDNDLSCISIKCSWSLIYTYLLLVYNTWDSCYMYDD